ncbi:MAG: hypothetical protein WCG80_02290 [Spirochaetales bacterium]
MNRALRAFLGLILVAALLPAQEEAPDYFLDPTLAQALQLEAEGSWTSRLAWGGGLVWGLSGVSAGMPPGLEAGLVFSQVPDLSVTAQLLERYYLKVVYTGTVESNTFEVGYHGGPEEWLRWVQAGNTAFTVPSRAGVAVAPGRPGSPALGLGLQGDSISQEFLLRYEDGSREVRHFRGFAPAEASVVSPANWIRGRFFQLPAGTYPSLRLWFEDNQQPDGYREAKAEEAAVLESGSIRLEKSAQLRLWVSWSGHAPELLYEPGRNAVAELQDHYALPAGATGQGSVVDKATGTDKAGFVVTAEPGADWFVVQGPAVPPFRLISEGLYPTSTTGVPPTPAADVDLEIRFPAEIPSKPLWVLGADVVPSSVLVTRNGFTETEVTLDPSSGNLTPDFPVGEADLVTVSFQRQQKSGTSPDLFAWQGGQWKPEANQQLEWNSSLRWNTVRNRFTLTQNEAPGSVSARTRWTGSLGSWSWDLSLQAQALLADSTAGRRLLAFDRGGPTLPYNSDSLRPAAAPGTVGSLDLGQLSRGQALYRDYFTWDALSGANVLSAWGKPGVSAETYTDGGHLGPYLALDEKTGARLAVLESALGPGKWTGMTVFLDKGRPVDLSATTRVRLPLRLPSGWPAGARLLVQFGALGEDFDGSGEVKSLAASAPASLPFTDAAQGFQLSFPLPETSTWTNDSDADGVARRSGAVLTLEVTDQVPPDPTGDFVVTLDLTDAERFLLSTTTAWSLLVVNPTSAAIASFPLLAGQAQFPAATWSVASDPGVAVGSVVQAVDLPDEVLGNQSRLAWSGRSSWTATARFSEFMPSQYRSLALEYRLEAAAATQLTVSMGNASGDSWRASWQVPVAADATTWQTANLDLSNGNLSVGGTTVPATVWAPGGTWDRISVSQNGVPTGVLYFRPPQASDAVWDYRWGTDVRVAWSLGDTQFRFRGLESQSLGSLPNWKAEMQGQTRVGPASFTGEVTLDQSLAVHSFYTAALSLAVPNSPWKLQGKDSFDDSGIRRESALVQLPWLGTWSAEGTADSSQLRLARTYRAGWAWDEVPQWTATANAQVQLGSFLAAPKLEWTDQWLQSWSWMVPETSVQRTTLEKLSGTSNAGFGPVSLKTEGLIQVLQWEGDPWKFSPSWTTKASLPVTWGAEDSPYVVEPRVSWDGMASWDLAQGDTAERLPSLAWTRWNGGLAPSQRRVNSAAGLLFSKGTFLAQADLGQSVGVEALQAFEVTSFSGQSTARFENLFGSAGQWPVFPAYRTDSLTWTLTTQESWGTRSSDNAGQVQVVLQPEVYLTSREKLALAAKAVWQSSATTANHLELQPQWSWTGPANLPWTLPGWISPPKFGRQLKFDTRMSWDFGVPDATIPLLRQVGARHQSTLTLSPKSELKLTLNLNQAWSTVAYVVGVQAALDVVLSF